LPYAVHDINKAPYSPAGDQKLDADFAVDGINKAIRFTTAPPAGTQITVVKRTGTAWDGTVNVQQDTGEIGRFLRATPGIWYVDQKQISKAITNTTFDSGNGSFDRNNITFDQGN
jgi:hypothetical protein